MSETWRPDKPEIWETHQKHIHGSKKIRQQTRSWDYVEQEVATNINDTECINESGDHCHDHGKPPTHQTDERVLLPLGMCGPPRRKNVQNNREAHD